MPGREDATEGGDAEHVPLPPATVSHSTQYCVKQLTALGPSLAVHWNRVIHTHGEDDLTPG